MKKLILYLLFPVTTLYTFFCDFTCNGNGMWCGTHSDKAEVVCEDGDIQCQEKISKSIINEYMGKT